MKKDRLHLNNLTDDVALASLISVGTFASAQSLHAQNSTSTQNNGATSQGNNMPTQSNGATTQGNSAPTQNNGTTTQGNNTASQNHARHKSKQRRSYSGLRLDASEQRQHTSGQRRRTVTIGPGSINFWIVTVKLPSNFAKILP